MGLCDSKEMKEQKAKNKEIEKDLRKLKQDLVIKLLLLGPGECGKSTVLKQMRIIHDNGFSSQEVEQRKAVVYNNTVQSMGEMLKAMDALSIQLDKPELEVDARVVLRILAAEEESEPFTDELYGALKRLWQDPGVKEAFERRSEYQLHDCAAYFLNDLDRIHSPSYIPNTQDILYGRVATMGVNEVEFVLQQILFRVFDVGGQKSERKKWIHCFDDVNAIIFIVAISEFNQTLREDGTQNRIIDSLGLFGQICNNEWFQETAMILFLNKTDLFNEKIKHVSIKIAFPEYTGTQTYDEQVDFLKMKFEDQNENRDSKTIYIHETCATNTNQVQLVLESVTNLIIRQNLKGTGVS